MDNGRNDRSSSVEFPIDSGHSDEGSSRSSPDPPKRKRDTTQISELEIDVDLPEPPSKKALRRAKKGKPVAPSSDNDNKLPRAFSSPEGDDEPVKGAKSENDLANESKDASSKKSERSPYGIWIGNLPFNVTKVALRSFLTNNASSDSPIHDSTITRIHLPAPTNAVATKTSLKPTNRGFAYIDFSSSASHVAALALSETLLGGRRVLIKDAKNFEGRPVKAPSESAESKAKKSKEKPATKRIFVGNLGFDVTREDLEKQFSLCDGNVEHVHMATFEDSGKCKGFAWITFDRVEAAQDAVRGFTYLPQDEEKEDEAQEAKQKGEMEPKKGKKWFLNRLHGRQLRCEFAEDASVRYKKRFGKGVRTGRQAAGEVQAEEMNGGIVELEDGGVPLPKEPEHVGIKPGAPTDRSKRRGRGDVQARYRTGVIVESQGTKTTFD